MKTEIEWIDPKERLPEVDSLGCSKAVLVMDNKGRVIPAYWQRDGWCNLSREFVQNVNRSNGSRDEDEQRDIWPIFAWAELPTASKEEAVIVFGTQWHRVLRSPLQDETLVFPGQN